MGTIEVLQIGFHNYGRESLGERGIQLCEIHQLLNRTHFMDEGIPFAWERWVRRRL